MDSVASPAGDTPCTPLTQRSFTEVTTRTEYVFDVAVADDLCQELETNGVEHEHGTDMPLCYKLAARIDGWTRG